MGDDRPSARRRIGVLAAEVGLNPRTIRYYEALGLLPTPPRTAAGYRLYGEADRACLRFIAEAKSAGLTLAEIGDILALRRAGESPCAHVTALVERKLAAVERQIRALAELRRELVALRATAAEASAAPAQVCGILERRTPPVDDRSAAPALDLPARWKE